MVLGAVPVPRHSHEEEFLHNIISHHLSHLHLPEDRSPQAHLPFLLHLLPGPISTGQPVKIARDLLTGLLKPSAKHLNRLLLLGLMEMGAAKQVQPRTAKLLCQPPPGKLVCPSDSRNIKHHQTHPQKGASPKNSYYALCQDFNLLQTWFSEQI